MKKIIPFKFSWQDNDLTEFAKKSLLTTAWDSMQQGLLHHEFHGFMSHTFDGNRVVGGFWDINNSTKHHGHFVVEGDIVFHWDNYAKSTSNVAFRWENDGKNSDKYEKILKESALHEICKKAGSGQEKGILYEEIWSGWQTITYKGSWEVQYAV